jgi:hypothetical protein
MRNALSRNIVVTLTGVLCGLSVMALPAAAEQFQITIENLSPNVLTPAPFITHDAKFDLFDSGMTASAEIELLAEDGVPDGVLSLAKSGLGGMVADFAVAGAGPLGPGESATVIIEADPAHRYLSFASMLAFSNDGFIGWALGDEARDLFPGGTPFMGEIIITPKGVWDAGTELNDELAAHVPALGAPLGAGVDEYGVLSRPHAGILGIGDVPIERNWTGGDVARITIVPEPASMALLGLGALLLGTRRR